MIIQFYREQDFDTLIRTRYAEISKVETEADIQSLIDRFTDRFQDPALLEEAVNTYQAARQIEPEISDGGMTAIYRLDDRFIKLSRMPNGNWGFHL